MRRGLHVLVAVHAGEHAAVDGGVLFAGVDGRVGVGSVGGWHCVGVAGEAFGILGFRLGGNSAANPSRAAIVLSAPIFPVNLMHKVHAGPHGLAVIRVTGESPRGDGVDVTLLRDRVNDGEPGRKEGLVTGARRSAPYCLPGKSFILWILADGWLAKVL